MTFKALGDAAVEFDTSGYAALGWSVVSFGLKIAANEAEARAVALESSEVITFYMAKYRKYEAEFRDQDAGEDFDLLLTKVYQAILLYVVALDDYLRQGGIGLLSPFWMLHLNKSNHSQSAIGMHS